MFKLFRPWGVLVTLIVLSSSTLIAQLLVGSDELGVAELRSQLMLIPAGGTSEISLPNENGKWQNFYVRESNFLSNELQERRPDFKSFVLWSTQNRLIRGRVSISKFGLDVFLLTPDGLFRIQANGNADAEEYIIYVGEHPLEPETHDAFCTADHTAVSDEKVVFMEEDLMERQVSGDFMRNYRLAIVTTGQFYLGNGATVPLAETAVMNSVASAQAIFENELTIGFTLLSPTIYTDPATDPFTPGGNRGVMAAEAIHSNYNINSYDIGHVFHNTSAPPTNQYPSGGVGYFGACNNNSWTGVAGPFKAAAWSGSANNLSNSWIWLLMHEFGHQFGAHHTFNGSGGSCNATQYNPIAAVEIGSGTTFMSYRQNCASSQNIPYSVDENLYYHVFSLGQINNYINNSATCNTETATGNTPPIAVANPCGINGVIPKSTPFELKGQGIDPDNDILTYTWEQIDVALGTQGLTGSAAANNPFAPIFRSYPPSLSPNRTFPHISLIVNNNYSSSFEPLPTVARELNFGFTVRDNHPGAGGIDYQTLSIQVDSTGPFSVLSPNGFEVFNAGDSIVVSWNVNGTDDYCSNVNIRFSIDGGYSFPYLLAENTPNTGHSTVYVPLNFPNTFTSRVRVECADNPCVVFFDISDNDFVIISNCSASVLKICPTNPITAFKGSTMLNLDLKYFSGEPISEHLFSTSGSGNPTYNTVTATDSGTCYTATSTTAYDILEFSVLQNGIYSFTIEGFGPTPNLRIANIFEGNFSPQSACDTWIASNAWTWIVNNVNSYWGYGTFETYLSNCVNYFLVLHRPSSTNPFSNLVTFSGPGDVYLTNGFLSDYSYTFVAVEAGSGIIVAENENSNFEDLSGGDYCVYGIMFKNDGVSPPDSVNPSSFIGNTLFEMVSSGNNCLLSSDECKPMTILPTGCDAKFMYSSTFAAEESPYNQMNVCQSADTLIPLIIGNSGGAFTSVPTGLSIDSNSGSIVPFESDPGSYLISYFDTTENGCSQHLSITIDPQNYAGNSSVLDLCQSDPPLNLFEELGETAADIGIWNGPSELPEGYLGTFVPGINSPGSYTYTIPDLGSCLGSEATILVNVYSEPEAGISAAINYCENDTAFYLYDLLGGSPDPGGNWNGPSVLSEDYLGFFKPGIDSPGVYTYTLSGAGTCSDVSASIELSELSLIALCTNTSLELDENGAVALLAADIFNGVMSSCLLSQISLSQVWFDCDNIGENSVTLTITNQFTGDTSSCVSEVIIHDNEIPAIECIDDISVSNDFEDCGALVNYLIEVTDNCEVTLSYSHEPGSFFSLGITPVLVTSTDLSGNSATCSFDVIVIDTEVPEILCHSDTQLIIPVVESYAIVSLPNALASDNCGFVDITNSLNINGPIITDTFPLGESMIIFYATDLAGNTSTCTTFIAVENEFSIQCPADITIDCISNPDDFLLTGNPILGGFGSDSALISYNDEYAIINPICPQQAIISRVFSGITISGAEDECIQFITQTDTTPPTIISQPQMIFLAGNTSIVFTGFEIIDTTASFDNCGSIFIESVVPADFTLTQSCTTLILTVMVSDGCGNIVEISEEVLISSGFGGLETAEIFNLSETYCINDSATSLVVFPEGGTLVGSGVSGLVFDPKIAGPGIHTVIYTATDANGCEVAAVDTIEVFEAPVVSLALPDNSYCPYTEFVDLIVAPAGGTVFGTAVDGLEFSPLEAGSGIFDLIYIFEAPNGCVARDTFFVEVYEPTHSTLSGLNQSYCDNDPIVQLSPEPEGGVVSGSGVTDFQFNPSNASIGENEISYSFVDSFGCSYINLFLVDVLESPNVDLGQDTTIYEGEILVLNAGGSPESTYQWNTGDTTQHLLISQSGTYNVTVTGENGCVGFDEITIEVVVFTGNPELIDEFYIYPNPTKDVVQVFFTLRKMVRMQIEIFDITGKIVRKNPFLNYESGEHMIEFDLRDLSAGNYLFRVITDENQIVTHSIVKINKK